MPQNAQSRQAPRGSYLVALVLGIGICTALNLFTIAVLYDALFSDASGLSENGTQVLTGWGGGILGVIGAVVGYQAGQAERERTNEQPPVPMAPGVVVPPDPGVVEETPKRQG